MAQIKCHGDMHINVCPDYQQVELEFVFGDSHYMNFKLDDIEVDILIKELKNAVKIAKKMSFPN